MAEVRRFLSNVTQAFVDRTPIDWASLLARARTSSERALFENLRLLDTIRDAAPRVAQYPQTGPIPYLLVRCVVALAALHVASGLIAIVLAATSSGTVPIRTPQLVLIFSFVGASLYLAATTSRDQRSLSLLGVFLTGASPFVHGTLMSLQSPWSARRDFFIYGIFPEVFTPAFLWQFALDFPRVQRFTYFDVLARRATAGAWLCGLLLFCTNFAVEYQFVEHPLVAPILPHHASHIFWYLYAFALVLPLSAIHIRSHRAPLPERRRVARFAWAIVAGATPFVVLTVARMIVPSIDLWFRNASDADRIWIFVLVLAPLTATPILTTAAVIADRPFELQKVLGRISRYVFSRAALTMTIAAPFAVLLVILYGSRYERIADVLSGSRAWLVLCCAAAGCTMLLARSRLLNAIDKHLLHRTTDHYEQLERALQRVRVARGTREIAAVLTRELRKGTGAETVRVLVPDPGSAFADSSQSVTPLPTDTALIAMLRETTKPIDLSTDGPLHALLPTAERDWVESNDVSLVAALQHKDDELAAIAVLGPKRGGVPFDRRDRWLINALIAAASAAWDADTSKDDEAREPASRGIARINARDEAGFECPRCGRVADSERLPCDCGTSPELAGLPHLLGEKFVIQRRLGAGGMGVVYLAHDMTLGRDVALKTLPELRPGAVTRLRDEARAMAALSHESLATIYGLELWRRTPVLVVEYFPDGTLAHKLAHGALSPTETVKLGIDLARALDYIHARGMLHRDLKPSNVALTSAGAVKLLDFGLTTLITASASESLAALSERGEIIAPSAGTPAYLPPEAYQGATPSPAFDLWAFAVTLLESLTGTNPFATDHRANTARRILHADAADVCGGLVAPHPDLRAFFERALARQPEHRFHSAHDVGSALEAVGNALAAVNRGSN